MGRYHDKTRVLMTDKAFGSRELHECQAKCVNAGQAKIAIEVAALLLMEEQRPGGCSCIVPGLG